MKQEVLREDILNFLSIKKVNKKGQEELEEKYLTPFFKEKYQSINPDTKEIEHETREFSIAAKRVIKQLITEGKIAASGYNYLDQPYWEDNQPTKYKKVGEVNVYAKLIVQ